MLSLPRALFAAGVLLSAGCSRPVLPTLTLAGRAGLDLAERRHGTLTAHVGLGFALERSATPGAGTQAGAFSPQPGALTAPCAGDALCRYVRRAAERALAGLPEVP